MPITDPTDIANCSLWLDAGQGVTTDGSTPAVDNDSVGTWLDQSGNSRNASQATGANKPVYKTNIFNGQPTLRFDGNDYLTTASMYGAGYNGAFTKVVVAKQNAILTTSQMTSSADASYNARKNGQLLSWWQRVTPNFKRVSGVGLGLTVEVTKHDGTYGYLRANGAGGRYAAAGNIGIAGAEYVGSYFGGTTLGIAGDVAELVVYNRCITDQEESDLLSHLLAKYGLTAALPDHIICCGDSITRGLSASDPATTSYPALLQASLTGVFSVENMGVDSTTVDGWNSDSELVARIEQSYRADSIKNTICCWFGTNDLFAGASAATTITRLIAFSDAKRPYGYKLVLGTILPRSGGGTPGDFETKRGTVNSWMRSTGLSYFDKIADFDPISGIGASGDELGVHYSDGTHLDDSGYVLVTPVWLSAVSSLYGGGPRVFMNNYRQQGIS